MKILIGYDGSVPADGALFDLSKAGLPEKAQALVLVAVPPIFSPESLSSDPTGANWYAAAYAEARSNAEKEEAEARKIGERAVHFIAGRFPGWKVKMEIVFDFPANAILDRADAWKADLIVVGSHGWTRLGGMLLGSTSEKVVAHAHGSVRIGKPSAHKNGSPPSILVAVDGSRGGNEAIAEMARRHWPKGTSMRFVACLEFRLNRDEIEASLEDVAQVKPALGGNWPWMEKKLEAAAAKLARKGVKVSTVILDGDPRIVLLAEAKVMDADAIVLGSRGLSGFKRFFLGSVSSGVASQATCSVEIIRGKNQSVAGLKKAAVRKGGRRALASTR